ncbi:trifunctional purine biosynthetic protein adenosine-3 isoform X1 [Anopheles ziemanni]|uniref:trifunctional purine biosynthetic protein adenosine-3 isoform X1 n=1 Tax=Anopheles coustani TaxID=139045 RepID=UPI00265A6A3A|nr:trifunctional purine biosynthetic protein adenosine-3 isoform X1 [Anopheles coustani]XP_058168128.1 trifunctional purine biosynthetic protein adenosine-3 isoform X1 [Anopheles ziemanni]
MASVGDFASKKKVLVIGSGGREHAICWKLSRSDRVAAVYALPGSPGIAAVPKLHQVSDVSVKDFNAIVTWCKRNQIDLVAVGPEDPLADGLGDVLRAAGVKCFGPGKRGAQIEADKNWSKDFMHRHGIPTARYASFTEANEAKAFIRQAPYQALVVKAAGLAAGKGVIVAESIDEACAAVDDILGERKFGAAGEVVVVEEKLSGEEVSVLAFVDSRTVRVMLPAQDHKRLLDQDRGPNTGGMGAYCPCPIIKPAQLELVVREVLQRAVDGLREEGIQYNGVLYAGMMLTPNGPKTLEFNCRFGDPETQVILPLLETDLYEVMDATCDNRLHEINLKFRAGLSAVGVVMASKGYPETSTKGCVIKGLDTVAARPEHLVFHSGVAKNDRDEFVTNGGRVLIGVVLHSDLKQAAALATAACSTINFEGSQHRLDIAQKAFKHLSLSYKSSGVDIDAGDALVQRIKPLARGTNRPGVIGGLGGFGGLFRLNDVTYKDRNGKQVRYKDPVLVQGTDGVGTKLKIAEALNCWDTIGIDLVAMCANDVLCAGAEPLAFLDYIACGRLEVPTAALIVKGIAEGCRETNCALLGGETAEMPSMYAPGKYDLAGYCVGVVEADQILPRVDRIKAGDLVIGLPSSGVHSNGFSLVNKILETTGTKLTDRAPFGEDDCSSFGDELLTPTRLYVAPVLPLLRQTDTVRALAHITGGGLVENVPRVLSKELAVEVDFSEVVIPPIFGWLAAAGNVTECEMLRTFNCGIGMVLIVDGTDGTWKEKLAGQGAVLLGKVTPRKSATEQQVVVHNFSVAIERSAAPYRNKFPVKPSSGSAKTASSISYKDSGVDITAGDDLVQKIKPFAKSTNRPGVMGGLGGFGGLYRLRDAALRELNDPILVLGTDGVGTKLKIAQDSHRHGTVGIDLVAMCVNDIICNGADPVNFLDYYACGKLNVPVAAQVIEGIAEGCRQGGSALLGGETAEMPGMYAPGVYDLAGFSLGIVEQSRMLPKVDTVCPGDVIIGLPSSGVHSNGFSLVHKILEFNGLTLNDVAPFSATGKTFAEELLVPTKIYVRELQPLLAEDGLVKALAHITGGGFTENIPRVLPADVAAFLDLAEMHVLPIFGWLARAGNVTAEEMLRTFNCGIGMMLVVPTEHRDTVLERLEPFGGRMLGTIVRRTDPLGGRVIVHGFEETLQQAKVTCTLPKKRIAVLISGSGSNLQALIDATRNTAFGIRGEIVLVVSNKDGVFGLERAAKAGIPSKVILHKNYATRELFDEAVSKALVEARIELVCLAGFMRILSEAFVKRWKGKLINIHPALLPKHKGTHAQRQALAAGDLESGCTVHFVDEGVDTGAIILQHRVPILRNDTEETLTERIHRAEHRAYPEALRLVANQTVTLSGEGQVVWN